MAWTLNTSGSAFIKAGLTESQVLSYMSGSDLDSLSDEMEGYISAMTRYDVVTNYSSLTNPGKQVLGILSSNLMAQKIAGMAKDEYGLNREFETFLDIIENDIDSSKRIVTDTSNKTFLGINS